MTIKTAVHRTLESGPGRPFRAGRVLVTSLAAMITACSLIAADAPDSSASDKVVSFAEGKWDAAKWTPVRLPHQTTLRTFVQRDESIGVDTFTGEEKKNRLDNVLLLTDTGTDEGEVEVVFSLSEEQGTAPCVFLSPLVKDGVLYRSFTVFVASYTMAIWRAQTDPDKGETKYTHLVRMNRWTEPNQKHVLRCRYSRKSNAVTIRLDQCEPIMLRDIGMEVNSLIGVWGCHGRCDFYSVKFMQEPTLEWSASRPKQ